jgi:hypothetical protein
MFRYDSAIRCCDAIVWQMWLPTISICPSVSRMLVHIALATVSLTQRKLKQSARYFADVECIGIDRGVCSWPWQWLALMRDGSPLFVTSDRRIFIWNAFGWSEIVSCACRDNSVISILFRVVRALRKIEFRLVRNQKTKFCSNRDSCFWQDSVCFTPTGVANVKGLYPSYGGHLHSL